MAAVADIKREWRMFKHDEPGQRFVHQHERLQNGSRDVKYMLIALGVLLVAGGVVLLFVPGPGLLLIVFGLGCLTGLSSRLARVMDRVEPPLRTRAERVRAWWKGLPLVVKALLSTAVAILGVAVVYGMYRWLVA